MAAGLGFKTFTTGEVLTAADVNGYLMQGVLVFANAAARTSAITLPQEGQYSFLKDTNALEYYDGASWVGAPVGDITAVNAGTGISGGGSSGSVTITNDMATTITASGDIVVGTGNGTYDNLPIGSTGQVLTADTTVSPYKVKWAAPAGGGKVLQVVYGNYSTPTTVASGTFTDTGLSLAITPTSATSKVYILATQNGRVSRLSNEEIAAFRILRGSTVVFNTDTGSSTSGYTGMGGGGSGLTTFLSVNHIPLQYLDSPATTSAITYKIQTKVAITANSGEILCQYEYANSAITLIEIGA
jgi:hypothetical protein